jgi:hypothetical protein
VLPRAKVRTSTSSRCANGTWCMTRDQRISGSDQRLRKVATDFSKSRAATRSISIRQLKAKAKAEVGAGLKAAALAIYLPEVPQPLGQNITPAACGLPSVLHTPILHKIQDSRHCRHAGC